MKTHLALLLVCASTLATSSGWGASAWGASEGYRVDAQASKVEWLGKKVAGQHNGTIGIKEGSVQFKGRELVGGSFKIDMTSIKNLDLTDAEWNGKLVAHLHSDDFFSTNQYKEAAFVIKSVKPAKGSDGELDVHGDLTIKGKTHPISFPAKVSWEGDQVRASGKIKVDRTKYGIRYGSGKFFQNLGDKMIHDDFELSFVLNAKK